MSVSAARLREAMTRMSGSQRKLLEATPLQEAWQVGQIVSEVGRVTQAHIEPHAAMHWLQQLKGFGLVQEVKPGFFRRLPVREEQPRATLSLVDPTDNDEEPEAGVPDNKEDLMARLAEMSATAREGAKALSAMADALDEIAITMDDRIKEIRRDSDKLRALRELLKGA